MTDSNDDTSKPQDGDDLMDDLIMPELDGQHSGTPSQPEEPVEADDTAPEPSDDNSHSMDTADQPSDDDSRPVDTTGQPSNASDEAFAQLSAAVLPDSVPFPRESLELAHRSNAYISEEMWDSLPKLKLALEDAYEVDNLTKSLLVELSIRMAMRDVVLNEEESVLAQWAKSQT